MMNNIDTIKNDYKKTKLGWIPEDWRTCTFADIADKKVKWSITGGPFGSDLKAEHYTESGVRIIQLQNIGDGQYKNDYQIFTSEEKANQLLGCNIYPGDLILSKMGDPVTRTCLIPDFHERYVMGSDGIRLVPDGERFDKIFVLLYLNYSIFRKIAIAHSTGSTRQRIGLVDLKKLPFILPPLPEQQRIATILSTWDKAINRLETLISEKETLKKGLMQVLLTGKKRFPGFTEVWSYKTLNDLCSKISDGLHSTPIYVERSSFYFINGNNLNNGKIVISDNTKCVSEDEFIQHKRDLSERTILLSINGTIGKIAFYNNETVVLGKSAAYLNVKEGVSKNFIYYQLKTHRINNLFNSLVTGSTIKNLGLKSIKSTKITLPTIQEQKKVVSVLSAADKEIETLKKELNSFKEQKRGLMQKLLTGEVRVKI